MDKPDSAAPRCPVYLKLGDSIRKCNDLNCSDCYPAAPRQPEGPQATCESKVCVDDCPCGADHPESCGSPLPCAVHPVEPQDLSAASEALAFFASVIKSGESWSAQCQAAYDKARSALAAQPAVSRADAAPLEKRFREEAQTADRQAVAQEGTDRGLHGYFSGARDAFRNAASIASTTSADAPLDALRDVLNDIEHTSQRVAALAAAPRDRPDAMALRDEQWRLAVSGERMSRSEPHLKTADWEALREPLDKLMAGAAAPLGAPVARLDAHEAVLAERKKWQGALVGACDRCLRSAAGTRIEGDELADDFPDCKECGTALRDLVQGVEPIGGRTLTEKQSPAPAATHQCRKCGALYRQTSETRDPLTYEYLSPAHCEPSCSTSDVLAGLAGFAPAPAASSIDFDKPGLWPLDKRCADALADEVAVLVRRKVIDSRSPAADALLDYRNPPSSPRADRLAQLESQAPAASLEVEALDALWRLVQLKDGPRNAAYEEWKPKAWNAARAVIQKAGRK